MRQRKKTREEESSETLTSESREIEEEVEDDKKGLCFYACYLLVSLSPRHRGHTYIGFTVNPRRRIRQHNGEIGCGAWRTKKRRPWEMVLCIHGFPSNVSALQFEWAWQHPNESLAVRKAAASFKSLSGVANKIKLAYTMLTLPSWQSLNMTVNYFSTKYTKHSAGCPGLPGHMKVRILPMDELPCYVKGRERKLEDDGEWGNEKWEEEACDVGKDSEETSSGCVFGSSQEHDKSSVDETTNDCDLFRWFGGVADRRELSSFHEFYERPSLSNVEAGNHSFVEEIAEDTGLSPLIKDGSFRLEPLTRERSTTVLITLDDEEPPQERRRVVPGEIEVIDVATPSPLCGTSLRGKKRRVSSACPDIIDLTKSPGFVQL